MMMLLLLELMMTGPTALLLIVVAGLSVPASADAETRAGDGLSTRGRGLAPPAATRVAGAPTAEEVMAGVQQFYAGVGQVSAKFRQEVVNATFGKRDISDGLVQIKKPGNMRWQYYAKKRRGKVALAKDFISNGTYLYLVDYENRQVIKRDLRKNILPAAVTFLYGKGDLGADFEPSLDRQASYGGKGDLVLRLVPKAPSAQYKTLHLVVDPTNFRVKESIIVDAAGNKNHFRFYEPNFDKPLADKDFQFSEKSPRVKAFRVIDDDQADSAPVVGPAPGPAVPSP